MKTPPIPLATLLAGLSDPDPNMRCQSIKDILRQRNERGQAVAPILALLRDPM